MKNVFFLLAVLAFFTTSCSQCYECTYEVEIEQNGQIVTDEVTEDLCTASADELAAKEADGYDCTVSGF